jgi:hypothetical protein
LSTKTSFLNQPCANISGTELSTMTDDIFDAALNLEDTSYSEGYALGHSDGSKAGLIEGRAFGLEKGFEKFLEMGRLHGRAVVWGARIPAKTSIATPLVPLAASVSLEASGSGGSTAATAEKTPHVPLLAANARLEKHIHTLWALTEAKQVITLNTEEAVSEVDDRIKRATSKAKVIERIAGEQPVQSAGAEARGNGGTGVRLANAPPGERNIEDFTVGVPRTI